MILDSVRYHYLACFGEASRTASFETAGFQVHIYKWNADINQEGVFLYATLGTSAYPVPGYESAHRLDLVAGLLPENDRIAWPLADLASKPVLRRMELGHGHTVTFPEPLWPGTEMRSFLILQPHMSNEIVPALELSDGLHVEFLQVVPIFPSELNFKAEHGVDSLMEHWEARQVPFWDPNRSAGP
jgi:hypothetical protein